MKKKLFRKFTLIELLVVITIIAVLMGLLMPSLTSARDSASRTNSNNYTKQIAMAIAGETALSRKSTYSGLFRINFRTLTGIEADSGTFNNTYCYTFSANGFDGSLSSDPLLDTQIIPDGSGGDPGGGELEQGAGYAFLNDFSGRHPFDPDEGYYVFAAEFLDTSVSPITTRAKKKNDISTRVSGEVYTSALGDSKSGISYSDGHTSTMNNVDIASGSNSIVFSGYIYTLNESGEPTGKQAID